MPVILFVRVKSAVEAKELDKRINERKPKFKEVPGLIQKIYGRDPATNDFCGIYFFKDKESLEKFRSSELAKTIGTAYEATQLRREVYELMYPLYPEKGPFPA